MHVRAWEGTIAKDWKELEAASPLYEVEGKNVVSCQFPSLASTPDRLVTCSVSPLCLYLSSQLLVWDDVKTLETCCCHDIAQAKAPNRKRVDEAAVWLLGRVRGWEDRSQVQDTTKECEPTFGRGRIPSFMLRAVLVDLGSQFCDYFRILGVWMLFVSPHKAMNFAT